MVHEVWYEGDTVHVLDCECLLGKFSDDNVR